MQNKRLSRGPGQPGRSTMGRQSRRCWSLGAAEALVLLPHRPLPPTQGISIATTLTAAAGFVPTKRFPPCLPSEVQLNPPAIPGGSMAQQHQGCAPGLSHQSMGGSCQPTGASWLPRMVLAHRTAPAGHRTVPDASRGEGAAGQGLLMALLQLCPQPPHMSGHWGSAPPLYDTGNHRLGHREGVSFTLRSHCPTRHPQTAPAALSQ